MLFLSCSCFFYGISSTSTLLFLEFFVHIPSVLKFGFWEFGRELGCESDSQTLPESWVPIFFLDLKEIL